MTTQLIDKSAIVLMFDSVSMNYSNSFLRNNIDNEADMLTNKI